MELKTRSILFMSLVFLFCACTYSKKHIASWSFKQNLQKETLEEVSNNYTSVQSLKPNAEFVAGISGKGFRTDGYSTFINTEFLNNISSPVSLEGWFALETYPTDTAGFFSLKQDSMNWISACVDQFGEPMISVCDRGKIFWYPSNIKIEKFKWLNVVLSVSVETINLYLNGERIVMAGGESFKKPDSFTRLSIGRDSREKKVHIFPTTYINGIIDEVKVWNKALSESDLNKDEIKSLAENTPSLTVPKVRFEADFNRPKYHLLPAANWTNETHGLIYYEGRYHIFNQKNGSNVYLGQINWGHFSSPDLVQWTEHRPALTPEPGYDQLGIWSGHCVLDDQGNPVIIYTGGNGGPNGMCLAFPKDSSLLEWEKYNRNPVIDGPPQQYTRKDFRDPYVWKENDTWFMIIGFGIEEEGVKKGTVLLYQSSDLKNWEYIQPLFVGDPGKDSSGIFWEMPVFWKMKGKYVLLVNPIPYDGKPAVSIYWVGDFVNNRFVPDPGKPQKLEVINRMLSPSVALDENGQTSAIAIIPDLIPAELQMKQGWTHLYSIPRIWELKDGKICQQPHPGLKKLRKEEQMIPVQTIRPGSNLVVHKGSHQMEILVDLIPTGSTRFGFVVGKGEKEETKIYYDFTTKQLVADLTYSSQEELIKKDIETGDYDLPDDKPVSLHLFIDGSVIEGFINGKDAFTTRIFPKQADSNQVEIFTEGGNLQMVDLRFWELKSSNNQTDF